MLANGVGIGQDAGMDFAQHGLLDGLEGEQQRQREELLERLHGEGYEVEELKQAVKEKRLALLGVDRVLGGTYTASEVEERTGLPAGLMVQIRRLQGLSKPESEDSVFSDDDIEAARSTKLFLDAGLDQQLIIEITRVLGEGMSRLAATIVAAFAETFLQPGDSEGEVAMRFATMAEELTPAVGPILIAAFKAHLRASVQRGILSPAELASGDAVGAQEVAVCFTDLVGFTRLGGQVEVRELGTVAGELAREAAELAQEPVRLIKTIGDAAMFVSAEPAPLVELALKLVAAFEEKELPSLRAGIAFGPAAIRAGDYYGNSVNLASRVTGVARPGSVLCAEEVHNAAEDDFSWSAAGRHRLKGVSGSTPLYRARPLAPEDDTEDGARKRRGDRSRRPASS